MSTNTATNKGNVTEMPKTVGRKQVVKLSEPLETLDGKITSIELKEPRAGLILKYGQPYRTIVENDEASGAQRFEIAYIPSAMLMYIEAMSGVDASSLEDLSASDMNSLFTAVLSMLQPAGN